MKRSICSSGCLSISAAALIAAWPRNCHIATRPRVGKLPHVEFDAAGSRFESNVRCLRWTPRRSILLLRQRHQRLRGDGAI